MSESRSYYRELDAEVQRLIFGKEVKKFTTRAISDLSEIDNDEVWMHGSFSEHDLARGVKTGVWVEDKEGKDPNAQYMFYDERYGNWQNVHTWSSSEGMSRALLEHWRKSGMCCCINIRSDHGLVWDVSWTYADDDEHTENYLDFSHEKLEEAIAVAAIECYKRREQNDAS